MMSTRARSREAPGGLIAWGICWGLSVFFALSLSWLIRGESMLQTAPGGQLLVDAVCLTLAATLLLSALPWGERRWQLPLWAVSTVLSAWLILSRHGEPVPAMAPIGVGLIVFLTGGLKALLSRRVEPETGHLCALSVLFVSGAAPLWLGPAAEMLTDRPGFVTAVVAISPLSYLSVLIETDYLRYDWFYMNSVIGGLRYQYPSAVAATWTYALLATLCWWLSSRPRGGVHPRIIALTGQAATPVRSTLDSRDQGKRV
jgi:hypothetical protein